MNLPDSENRRTFAFGFILICFAMFFSRMAIQMYNAVFPLYVTGPLGFSKSLAGMFSSAAAMTAIFSRPVAGHLADRGKTKTLFLAGILLYAAGVFGSGIFTGVPLLFLLRVLCGAGQSTLETAGSAAASNLVPVSRMREGIGYLGLTSSFSQAIGPGAAILLTAAIGHRAQFTVSSLLLAVPLILGALVRIPSPAARFPASAKDGAAESKEEPARWWHKIIEKTALTYSVIMLSTDMSIVAINTFLLIRANELGLEGMGLFFTVQACAVTAVRLFSSKFVFKNRESFDLIIGLCGVFGALLAIFFASEFRHFMLTAAFYGLCTGNYYVSMHTAMIRNAPEHRRGLANSTYFISYDVGITIGAPLWGALADAAGTRSIYLFAAALPLTALLVYIFKIIKPRKRV